MTQGTNPDTTEQDEPTRAKGKQDEQIQAKGKQDEPTQAKGKQDKQTQAMAESDAPCHSASKSEAPTSASPPTGSSSADTTGADATGKDTSGTDTSGTDTPKPVTPRKDNRDIETLALMLAIHCRGKHKDEPKLNLTLQISEDPPVLKFYKVCEDCYELAMYASDRVDNCPIEDPEAFCSNCTVHCYSEEMRDKVRAAMRYAGPRMILYQPGIAIRHMMARGKKPKTS